MTAKRSPLEKSSAKPTKNDETPAPGSMPLADESLTKSEGERWTQVSLDQVTSITWVHDRDKDHYHDPYCEYRMRVVSAAADRAFKRSSCAFCGRTVESTLASYKVENNG